MIHLSDMTLVQMLLIEVGVVLQVIAVAAYFKGTASHHRPVHHGHDATESEQFVRDFQTGGHSQSKRSVPGQGGAPSHHHEFKAGRLTRTDKVGGFVQTFKFRE